MKAISNTSMDESNVSQINMYKCLIRSMWIRKLLLPAGLKSTKIVEVVTIKLSAKLGGLGNLGADFC